MSHRTDPGCGMRRSSKEEDDEADDDDVEQDDDEEVGHRRILVRRGRHCSAASIHSLLLLAWASAAPSSFGTQQVLPQQRMAQVIQQQMDAGGGGMVHGGGSGGSGAITYGTMGDLLRMLQKQGRECREQQGGKGQGEVQFVQVSEGQENDGFGADGMHHAMTEAIRPPPSGPQYQQQVQRMRQMMQERGGQGRQGQGQGSQHLHQHQYQQEGLQFVRVPGGEDILEAEEVYFDADGVHQPRAAMNKALRPLPQMMGLSEHLQEKEVPAGAGGGLVSGDNVMIKMRRWFEQQIQQAQKGAEEAEGTGGVAGAMKGPRIDRVRGAGEEQQ